LPVQQRTRRNPVDPLNEMREDLVEKSRRLVFAISSISYESRSVRFSEEKSWWLTFMVMVSVKESGLRIRDGSISAFFP